MLTCKERISRLVCHLYKFLNILLLHKTLRFLSFLLVRPSVSQSSNQNATSSTTIGRYYISRRQLARSSVALSRQLLVCRSLWRTGSCDYLYPQQCSTLHLSIFSTVFLCENSPSGAYSLLGCQCAENRMRRVVSRPQQTKAFARRVPMKKSDLDWRSDLRR